MKNYKTKAEALKALRLEIPKRVREVKNGLGTSGKAVAIEAVLKALTGANGAAEFRAILDPVLNNDSYSKGPTFYASGWGYGTEYLIKSKKPANSWREQDRVDSPFVEVAGKKTHILELNETISVSDWSSIACSTDCNMLDELIYEYSVTVGDVGTATRIAERFNELNDNRGPKVSSARLADYEPFLVMVRSKKVQKKSKWVVETLANYMEAFRDSEDPSDRELNSRLVSEFRDIFRHCNSSIFNVTGGGSNDETNSAIDDFDIIESSASARKNLFSIPGYQESRKMADLAKRDPERLARIATRHLNAEHPNGIRRSQFLRMYRKISEHVKLDPMDLNTKLQSYVLLEEIN